GGAHGPLTVGGDAVETLFWHFGEQAVAAEFGDQAGDAGAAAAGFLLGSGRLGVEAAAEVAVAEADDRVLAGEDGVEERELGLAERVEAGVAPPPLVDRPAVPVEHGDAVAVVVGGGERVQV